ncbi:Hypp8972 [Branchiostoma lanceolatum]|uniref:Hypp8972 protein n=1 Tax=Branchiostoma lanceolatum TaxID=7740 RepID=A0A8J9ZAM1_BRALA|nr:Hypp8972 [Branchiostoma lanceolatum]
MRIVVAFVSAVLLALQLAPTSALVIRPRRELPDFFSQILQRVKKDAVVDDSSDTREEDGDKKCTRDEDCEEGQFCIPTGPSTWHCQETSVGAVDNWSCSDDGDENLCPLGTHCHQGRCNKIGHELQVPPGHEGAVCEVADDCKKGLCCGYLNVDEYNVFSPRFCKPFIREGEPCYHAKTTVDVVMIPGPLILGSRKKRQLQGGDCCEPGLHCGKEGVCIADEDRAHDTKDRNDSEAARRG